MIRRKYRRALNTVALALTASVMLNMTGCGGIGTSAGTSTEATDTAKGRYIESEINMPADCSSPNVVTFDDGSTAFVDTNNGVLYTKTSIDQKDWQGRDIPKLIELIGQSMDIEVAVPSKDGKLFISYNNWDEVEDVDSAVGYPVHYLLIDSDDSVRELTLTDIEKLEHAVFSDEDTLYLGDYDGRVMRHSISSGTSEKILNTDNGYIETLNIFNNKLCCIRNFLCKSLSYPCVRCCIDSTCRVVKNKNLWLFKQCSSNGNTLFLTARYISTATLNISVVLFGESLNKIISARKLAGIYTFLFCCVFVTPTEVI